MLASVQSNNHIEAARSPGLVESAAPVGKSERNGLNPDQQKALASVQQALEAVSIDRLKRRNRFQKRPSSTTCSLVDQFRAEAPIDPSCLVVEVPRSCHLEHCRNRRSSDVERLVLRSG